ncbi:hypothetical protein [Candidatus Binatus sp.]|uniref:hypothetical protein n=1 Tax=Candidatus Binatus sp. TaxID=2811406 RepID=UPI00272B31CF|nr:hypothetical protein [Candidatus Binatus sp.]
MVATTFCACAALLAGREAQEKKHEMMVKRMDTAHIFITPGDIPAGKPYKVLGELRYSEPFSLDVIDSAKIEVRLKAMALEKYHGDADAVIKANVDVDASGETVTVTGVAIQFESSADREMMHKMWEGMIVSPK